jgi:hypothetical protein
MLSPGRWISLPSHLLWGIPVGAGSRLKRGMSSTELINTDHDDLVLATALVCWGATRRKSVLA